MPNQEPLEERLRRLAEQAQADQIPQQELGQRADAEVKKELANLAAYANNPKTSKEELLALLAKVGAFEDARRIIKKRIGEIEEEERRVALIEGPAKIVLEYGELPKNYYRFDQSKDEIIYVLTNGKKRSIFIASAKDVYKIRGMALSPHKERLAFDCKSIFSSIALTRISTLSGISGRFDPNRDRQIFIINIDGWSD